MCSCPAGENGNSCPHQATVVLKYGISNSNFIPTNHIDKYKLAVLAIGEHPDLCAEKFADIHQKKFDSTKTAITEPVVVNEIPKYVPLNDEPENVDKLRGRYQTPERVIQRHRILVTEWKYKLYKMLQ